MIIKYRSKGIKLAIKDNVDGVSVGQAVVHITSYFGILTRTMVPIRYSIWRHVPKKLKNKLWGSIEVN